MPITEKAVPVRVTTTLPHRVFSELRDRADYEGRSTSNLAAFLLEDAFGLPRGKPAASKRRQS
jgi:hypothetical protein